MFFSYPHSCHFQSKYININVASGVESILSPGNNIFFENYLSLFAFINFFQDDNVVINNDNKHFGIKFFVPQY